MATQKNVIENSVGSVGIGTTSPTQVLELKKTTGSAIALLNYNDSVKFNINASSAGVGYVGMVSNHPLLFVNNDTERMRLDTNGNLGIGTTSPGVKLQIQGLTRINADSALGLNLNRSATSVENGIHFSTAATTDWYFYVDNGNTNLQIQRSNELDDGPRLRFDGSNSNVLLNLGGGNVGIGLTSPTQKLEVAGFVMGGTSSYRTSIGANASGAYIYFGDTSNLYSLGRLGTYNALFNVNSYNGPISFQISDSEKVRIDSNGNLGIGTSSPAGKLDVTLSNVSLTTSAFGLDLKVTELAGGWARSNRIYNTNYTAGTTFFGAYGGASSISYAFWTLDNPASVDVTGYNSTKGIFLNSSGNVGINTTGFTTKFSVSDGTTIAQINPYSGVAYFGTINNYPMALSVNSSEKVRIDSNGSVGIGTSSPLAKLHILGDGGSTDYVYQRWSYTGNVNTYDLLLKQTVTSGVVRYNFSMINGGTTYNDVLVLDRGCVGIGTSLPVNLLNVHGTNPFVRINNTSNGDQGIKISYNNSDAHGLHLMYNPNNAVSYIDNTYATVSGQIYGDIYFRQNVAGTMTTRMTIKADGGNVGIGTTSPASQLQLSGSLQIGNGTNFGNKFTIYDNFTDGKIAVALRQSTGATVGDDIFAIYCNSTSGEARLIADDDNGVGFMTFYMNASERMRIANNGNVGIGTTSPAAVLHVYGGSFKFQDSSNGSNIQIGPMSNTYPYNRLDSYVSDNSGYFWGFGQKTSAGATRVNAFFLDNNRGLFSADALRVITWTSNEYNGSYPTFSTPVVFAASGVSYINGGNLGIGTTSPSTKLHVSGSAIFGDVTYNGSYGYYIRMPFGNGGNLAAGTIRSHIQFDSVQDYSVNTGNAWKWKVAMVARLGGDGNRYGNQYEILRTTRNGVTDNTDFAINENGNVGIATTSPSAKLHVNDFFISKTLWGDASAHSYWGNYSTAYGRLTWDTGLAWINATSGNVLHLGANGSNKHITIDTNGSVGIGTTSPAQKLHIVGAVYGTTYGQFGTAVASGTNASYGVFGSNSAIVGVKLVLDSDPNRNDLVVAGTSGNIGIGTTSPSSKLHIDDVNAPWITISRSGTPTWQLRNNYPNNQYGFSFNNTTAGTVPLFIGAGGNVGIGLDSPAVKLDIASTQGDGIVMRYDTSTAYQAWIRPYWNSGTDTRIDFAINRSANVTPAVIMSVGYGSNVGIGTTAPAAKLDVVSGSIRAASGAYAGEINFGTAAGDNTNIYLKRDNNYDLSLVQNAASGNALYLASAGNVYISIDSNNNGTTDAFIVQNNSVKSGTELFRVQENGNVGIGSSSPAYKLDVNGSINASTFMYVTYPYGDAYPLQLIGSSFLKANNNYYGLLIRSGDTNYISGRLSLIGGSSKRFEIHGYEETVGYIPTVIPGGNVGIGTTNPTYKLEVAGTLKTTSTITNDGGIYYGGGSNLDINQYNNGYMRFLTNNNEKMRIAADGNVGIGSSSPTVKFDLYNGRMRYYDGTFSQIPNVVSYKLDNNGTGGYAIKTPFLIGTSYEMAIVHVLGYVYGSSTLVDFKVVFYDYGPSNAPINYSMVDSGNDGFVKYLAKDSNGYINICFASLGSTYYYARFTVNLYATRYAEGNYSSGWTFTQTTSANYGMSALYDITPALTTTISAVGIGTVSPNALLDLYSSAARIRFNRASSYNMSFGMHDSSNSALSIKNAGDASTIAYFQYDGLVGIGTTNPLNKLSVIASNTTAYYNKTDPIATFQGVSPATILVSVDGNVDGYYAELKLGNAQSTYYSYSAYIRGIQGAGIDRYRLEFGTADGSAASTRMTIANNGNVGIGSTSPGAKLDVVGDLRIKSAGAAIILDTSTTSDGRMEFKYNGTRKALIGVDSDNLQISADSGNFLQFRTNSSERMRITNGGNIGIGTTNPGGKLEIIVSGASDYLRINDTTGVFLDVGRNFITSRGANLTINCQEGAFNLQTAGTTRINVENSTGNVGIGTTSPSTKLDVVGNYMSFGPTTTAARRRQTIAGEITVAGNNTTTKMFTCGSFGTGTISIIAFVTDPSNCATALFSFCHNNPSSGGVGAQTTNRLSFTASVNGVITQIYLDMGNSNPSTQYNVTVTYTGSTAPTVIFSAEGHGSQIWAL